MEIKSFRDLTVWQKAMVIVKSVYQCSMLMPKSEQYGLVSQIQRAAVSIPSNIAEGCQRNNRAEFKQFCGVAYGSAAELETQLIIMSELYKIDTTAIIEQLNEVQRMLRQLIARLTTNH